MATLSSLPKERKEDIFSFLEYDVKALSACIRVNRQWAEMCLPILWQRPLEVVGGHSKSVGKLIWEYISWLPTEVKEDLVAHDVDIPPHIMAEQTATFDYVGYMRVIEYDHVCDCVSSWLDHQCWVYAFTNNDLDWQKMLVTERLFQLLMSRAKALKYLSVFNTTENSLPTVPFHRFPGANTALSHITTFDCRFASPTMVDLAFVISRVCQSIETLSIGPSLHQETARKLIAAQRRLRRFTLNGGNNESLFIEDLEALDKSRDSLESLSFYCIDFLPCYTFEALARCKKLRRLEFFDCVNINAGKMSALARAQYPELNILTLSGLRELPSDETASFIKSLAPCLRFIQFPLFANENQAIKLIDAASKCSGLATVKLCADGILQKFLPLLSSWKRLTLLSLNVQEIEPSMSELAKRLPESTRSINIITESLSEQALRNFLDKTKATLECVELICSQGCDDEHLTVLMRYAKKKNSLRDVCLTANQLSSEKLESARRNIPSVRVLN